MKLQGSKIPLQAICAALKELEKGCSVEDAKTVCEPGLLNQIIKWKVIVDSPFMFYFCEVLSLFSVVSIEPITVYLSSFTI